MTDSEKLQLANRAIVHVLRRIQESPEVGWYMGHGTESFARCCDAYAAIHGGTSDEAREAWAPISPRDPRRDLEKRIDELEEKLESKALAVGGGIEDVPTYGPHNLSAEEFRKAVQVLLFNHSQDPKFFRAAIAELFDVTECPIHLLKI